MNTYNINKIIHASLDYKNGNPKYDYKQYILDNIDNIKEFVDNEEFDLEKLQDYSNKLCHSISLYYPVWFICDFKIWPGYYRQN